MDDEYQHLIPDGDLYRVYVCRYAKKDSLCAPSSRLRVRGGQVPQPRDLLFKDAAYLVLVHPYLGSLAFLSVLVMRFPSCLSGSL